MDELSLAAENSVGFSVWLMYILVFIVFLVIGLLILDVIRRRRLLNERVSSLVMLEVRVPQESSKKEDEPFKEYRNYAATAEQLFSSFATFLDNRVLAWWYGQPVFSFEIIAKEAQIMFFIGVPKHFRETAEKQILSFHPNAQIESSDEFRIFDKEHEVSIGIVDQVRQYIFPIKTYQELETDPLNSITNNLSKLGPDVRGGVQFIIMPNRGGWRAAVSHAVGQLKEGKSISGARHAWVRGLHHATSALSSSTNATKQDTASPSPIQQSQIDIIQRKGEKAGFNCQIRIIAAAKTKEEAREDVRNIYASFAQFNAPDRNGFRLIFPRHVKKYLPYYIMRHFARRHIMLLNTEELSTVFHFPNYLIETPGIRWFLSKKAAPSVNLPTEGLVLGENIYRGVKTIVRLKADDRRRHLYTIGMTGTGKSTFFESMILQDIREGRGVAYFDPHGEAVEHILERIPKERAEDVIVFDPADRDRPFGLNLLEWKTPEQKDFLVQETVQIFYKLFDPNAQGFIGPQFEHWMRNAALTLMESPGGGTLIEIPRLFVDDAYRAQKIAAVQDPVVKSFWEKQLAKTADFHKSEMYNYFISKFGRFMTNDLMRNIMGQTKSSFDLQEIMDQKKILLVNLSKGRVGEVNSNLLGMILVARMFTAALARQEVPLEERADFYLYVDEFQNFATETFTAILSEARKYRLNLSITNQYIAQLPEAIRDAVIGNVGTQVAFRIGVPDAEFMAHEFAPVFNENDLTNIDAYNCYVKLLVDNAPTKPFSMQTIKDPTPANEKISTAVKQLSRLKFGRDRSMVEAEVRERIKSVEINEPNIERTREA
jgi:hypothetical protein